MRSENFEKGGWKERWISKKKWLNMEKRIAALEKKNEEQPKKIIAELARQLNEEMSKSMIPHHPW